MIQLFTFYVGLLACGGADSEPGTEPVQASEPAVEAVLVQPVSREQVKTTTCSLWMTNAQATLAQERRRYADQPDAFRMALAKAAFAMGEATANLDRVNEAGELATEHLASHPDDTAALELRLDTSFTLHRIEAAKADLARLAELSPDRDDLASWKAELQWLEGEVKAAMPIVAKSATERPNIWTLTRRANMHRALGEFAKAEADFAAAEASWRGTAPIPLAWLNVQRGLMELHRGRYEQAAVFFRAGYDRCPEYPMASEHLAEIEGRLGNTERSIELYRAVVEQTGDPEFLVALAEALGDTPESAQLIERARAENLARLQKYPEAMYWHAAEFFLGAGEDPQKGLELLTKNLELRPNHESRVALAAALLVNDKPQDAYNVIEPTLDDPLRDAEMYWTAARITRALGKNDESDGFASKARAMNPKIEDLEGPL